MLVSTDSRCASVPVLIQSRFQPLGGLAARTGEAFAIVLSGEDDPPRGVDQSDAVRETVLDRRFGVSALCAHAGDEERQIRNLLAEVLEFVFVRRADDESDVVVFVPEICERGDALVQSLAGLEFEVLEVGPAGIGRSTEDEDARFLVGKKRLKGVSTHVGVDRNRIDALENLGVLAGRVTDIGPFSV